MSLKTATSAGNAINLHRLVWLRLIVLGGEVAAIWIAITRLNIALPISPLVLIIGFVALSGFLTLLRLHRNWPVSDTELFAQFTLEVLALTLLLYYTGGSTNPFAPLYLIPLTLSAATLPGIYTWVMVLLTTICYTLLLYIYIPLPEIHGSQDHNFRLHVVGMWMAFILSASLIAGFAVRMAATVRRQDKKIAAMREQQLRQQQVLALGTLAAGAAHELGTPLSTMAILLKDIETDRPFSEASLTTLREQVSRCKKILGSISAAAGEIRAESGSIVRLDSYLNKLIQDWKLTRPDVSTQLTMNGTDTIPRIVADQTLEQALLNILNNAADASPGSVEININWNAKELIMNVADRGSGLAPDVADMAGDSIHSTKHDGLGLGLFLTYSTLERLGGEVKLFERNGGGVNCRIHLPLSALLITE